MGIVSSLQKIVVPLAVFVSLFVMVYQLLRVGHTHPKCILYVFVLCMINWQAYSHLLYWLAIRFQFLTIVPLYSWDIPTQGDSFLYLTKRVLAHDSLCHNKCVSLQDATRLVLLFTELFNKKKLKWCIENMTERSRVINTEDLHH